MEHVSPKTNYISSLGFWAGAIDHVGKDFKPACESREPDLHFKLMADI